MGCVARSALVASDPGLPKVDPPGVEWHDTQLRANQVLTMLAAIAIDRAGGELIVTAEEWAELNARYDGQAAILYEDRQDGSPVVASLDTVAGIGQSIRRRMNVLNERKGH
jgi:hypothetical protein